MSNPEYLLINEVDNSGYIARTLSGEDKFRAAIVGIGFQVEPFGWYKHVRGGEGILYKRNGD